MTAASGIMHKEYHEKEFSKTGGVFHMIQLWVNLPRKDKMAEPKYQALTKEMMGKVPLEDGKGEVTIVSGEFEGVRGPASTFTPINIYTVDLLQGGSVTLQEPADFNFGILVLEGELTINDKDVQASDFILFENAPGDVQVTANSEQAKIFILSGEPINEPIAAGGPYVMNTRDELIQARDDFNAGLFGTSQF